MKETITEVKVLIELGGNDYTFLCNLRDDLNKVWECQFSEISLLHLTHCIVQLFESENLKAKSLKFTFKNNQILVNKQSDTNHSITPYLIEISEQIVDKP